MVVSESLWEMTSVRWKLPSAPSYLWLFLGVREALQVQKGEQKLQSQKPSDGEANFSVKTC